MRTFFFCVLALLGLSHISVAAQTDRAHTETTQTKPVHHTQTPTPTKISLTSSQIEKAPAQRTPEIADPDFAPEVRSWLRADQGSLVSDSFIRDALIAYQAKDESSLKDLTAKAVEAKHPLAAYPQLWLLVLQARNATQVEGSKQSFSALPLYLAGDLARLIIANEGSYIAEAARVEWARLASNSLDASTFEMLYSQLEWNKSEEDLLCAHAQFSWSKKNSAQALKFAKETLRNARFPEGNFCKRLAEKVLSADPDWTWTYALLLMQKKRFSMAKELLSSADQKNLPVNRPDLLAVLNSPTQWFEQNRHLLTQLPARLLVFASLRLLPVNLDASVQSAQATRGRITPQAQAMLWGRIGYTAAVDMNPDALIYYERVGKDFPNAHRNSFTWAGDQLQLWYARAALRLGEIQDRLSAIETLPDTLKKSPSWIYWKGRSLLQLGQVSQAKKLLLPLTKSVDFYGLLACDALNLPYFKGNEVLTPAIDKASVEQFESNESLIRAQAFYRLELYKEGHREWNWAMRTMPSRKRLELAEYAGIKNLTHRQIFTSLRSGQTVFTQIFPRVHRQEIESAAVLSGLPIEWIYAIIHQESRFMRFAQSAVGAQGLMQVMPKTARWVAEKIALKNYVDGQLMQLQTNLLIGSQYLKLVRDSVDGNAAMTTASYNAGPLKAQSWRAALPRAIDGAAFAETIPYEETRDYVLRVTANMVQYSRYGIHTVRLSDILGEIRPQPVNKNLLP